MQFQQTCLLKSVYLFFVVLKFHPYSYELQLIFQIWVYLQKLDKAHLHLYRILLPHNVNEVVKPTIACLVVAYAVQSGAGPKPVAEAVLII